MIRQQGRRAFLLAALTLWSCGKAQVHAQSLNMSAELTQDAGWSVSPYGMRHFTGLRCPDRVGPLSRVKVLASAMDRIAGCIYVGDGGVNVVLRSHHPGDSAAAAQSFLKRYSQAGFKRIHPEGAPSAGVSFLMGADARGSHCETLWRFKDKKHDYTLWMAYRLPGQANAINDILNAFMDDLTNAR